MLIWLKQFMCSSSVSWMHQKNIKIWKVWMYCANCQLWCKSLGLIWFYIINFAFYVGAEIVSTFGKALRLPTWWCIQLLEVFRRLHQLSSNEHMICFYLCFLYGRYHWLLWLWCFFNTWKWVIVINDTKHLFDCPRPCWEGKGYVKLLKSILRSLWSVTLLLVFHV
jgi:hypothetical protein